MTARVISIDPVDRKIGLSIRAYKQNEEAQVVSDYGTSGDDSAVSIRDAVGDSVPASLLGAGGTFTEAANELMASVREQEETSTEAPADTEQDAAVSEGEPPQEPVEAGADDAEESEAPSKEAVESSDSADAPESENTDD